MQRRMLGGLLGTVIGAGIGIPLVATTRVASTPAFTMVLAMAIAGSVCVLVRRPPWRQASAVESLVRVVAGLALGAALAWLAIRFAAYGLPFAVPPLPLGVRWLEHPGVFGPLVGLVVGVLVGLEPNTPRVPDSPTGSSGTGDR